MRLRGLGYDVLDIAKDGSEAIEKASSLHPDLILMDIRLGEGIDGIEAARRIRARHDIPVVYVTAYADRELLDRARDTQPAGFINKPFTTKDLLTTINLALNRGGATGEAGGPRAARVREAIITTDREGRISFISSGAEQLTGWSRQNLLGQPLSSALGSLYGLSGAEAGNIIEAVLERGEDRVLHRGDEPAAASEDGDVLTPLRDGRGNHFGLALRFDGATVEASFAALQRLADACRHLLENTPFGVVLLERDMRIAHANQRAQAVLDRAQALARNDGYLYAPDEDTDTALHKLVEDALRGDAADPDHECGLLLLDDGSRARRVVAVVMPVPASEAPGGAALAALALFDLDGRGDLSPSILRRVYGLTRSEVRLVQALVGGCSLEDGAAALNISVNTARTHLKHIFNKTGARRQSELIHQVETGPASLAVKVRGPGSRRGDVVK